MCYKILTCVARITPDLILLNSGYNVHQRIFPFSRLFADPVVLIHWSSRLLTAYVSPQMTDPIFPCVVNVDLHKSEQTQSDSLR
jgi:hypothetical protein